MDRIAAFLLLLPFCNISLAQFIEIADQRTDDIGYSQMVKLESDKWVCVGQSDPESQFMSSALFATAYGASGDRLWTTTISTNIARWNTGLDHRTKAIQVLEDGSFLIAGWLDMCDVGSEQSAVLHLDGNGQVLWESTFELESERLAHLAQGIGAYHAAGSLERVFIMDASGESITDWISPQQPIHSMFWENDTVLLILADSALIRARWNGELISSIELGASGHDLAILDGRPQVMTIDSLLRFDPELSSHASVALNGIPGVPIEIILKGDTIRLLTTRSLATFDMDQSVFTTIDLAPPQGQSIKDGEVSNGILMTSGSMVYPEGVAGVLRSFDLQGNTTSHDVDVAIEATFDSTWTELNSNDNYWAMVRMRVRIVNHSNVVVDTLLISAESPYAVYYCINNTNNLRFTDLGLAPGADMDIVCPAWRWRYFWSEEPETFVGDVCVNALSPNSKMDRAVGDNQSCASVVFTSTVGLMDRSALSVPSASPNPFTDHIVLRSSSHGPLNITLLDATGREVLAPRFVPATGPTLIALSELTEGIYFLRTTDGKQQRTERLVKSAD